MVRVIFVPHKCDVLHLTVSHLTEPHHWCIVIFNQFTNWLKKPNNLDVKMETDYRHYSRSNRV